MKKCSVINFKGGVGKTTLSLHLACHLAESARVLLIDIDHQSSLSIVLLGDTVWSKAVSGHLTVNRVFESFCNRKIAMPGKEIVIANAMGARAKDRASFYPTLDFVSAQFELDDTEIDLASTTFGNANTSDWQKRTLLADWLDAIGAQDAYDYVLFDCPPATKIMSQNALACSDCYVVPVIPDELSSRGVTHFKNLVTNKIDRKLEYLRSSANVPESAVPISFVPSTKLAAIVPYLAKPAGNAASGLTNLHTEQINALRRSYGKEVIDTIGRSMTGVPEAVNIGVPVWNFAGINATDRVVDMMRKICIELKTRIDAI